MVSVGMWLTVAALGLVPTSTAGGEEESSGGGWGDFHIEYGRGLSMPTWSDIHLKYENTDVTFRDVKFEDRSFFPDDSILPNAFLKPLGRLDFGAAQKAFTEPYYGIRGFYFFKSHPNWGVGLDFIHFKVFVESKEQIVPASGAIRGKSVSGGIRVGEVIERFNVSHGINYIGLAGIYRQGFVPSDNVPFGRIQPFLALSVGPCVPHPEMFVLNSQGKEISLSYEYQLGLSNFGMGFSGGTRFQLAKHFGLYLEYKFTYTVLHGMALSQAENSVLELSFPDHHFQWGIMLIL